MKKIHPTISIREDIEARSQALRAEAAERGMSLPEVLQELVNTGRNRSRHAHGREGGEGHKPRPPRAHYGKGR
jgi:hypothetical protein